MITTDKEKRFFMIEESEITQIKLDIGELKINVSSIREDITDIKHSLSSNVDEIAKAIVMLATISEKQIYNNEEHKVIHNRIDEVKTEVRLIDTCQKNLDKKVEQVDTEHKACVERRKSDIENRKNSPFRRAIDKCIEYGIVIIMAILIYSLAMEVPIFFKFIDTKPVITNTILPPVQPVIK